MSNGKTPKSNSNGKTPKSNSNGKTPKSNSNRNPPKSNSNKKSTTISKSRNNRSTQGSDIENTIIYSSNAEDTKRMNVYSRFLEGYLKEVNKADSEMMPEGW